MPRYQVVVGNVGTVTNTDSLKQAREEFNLYVHYSILGIGNYGGESVTFWAGGEPTREHDPLVFRIELCEHRVRVAKAELALARAKLVEQRHWKRGVDASLFAEHAAVDRAKLQLEYAQEQLAVARAEAK